MTGQDRSLRDPLTGALTRQTLNHQLEAELARSRRHQRAFSILMLDLDYFKSINDAYGHQRGDQALIQAVERIRAQIRQSDDVYRYGGDEFIVLLPDTDRKSAAVLANRILEGMRQNPLAGEPPITLSVSIGVASYPEDAETIQQLFEVADQRHYLSKARGRGRVTWQDEEARPKILRTSPSRLIEREAAIACVKQFLENLRRNRRGALRVEGPEGLGQRRLLQSAKTMAKLQGFAVLLVEGRPALKSRQYGALANAFKGWTNKPDRVWPEGFRMLIRNVVWEKHLAGLVILVHRWRDLDAGSLDALRLFLEDASLPAIGLVYSDEGTLPFHLAEALGSEQAHCRLEALSQEGIKIWLRYCLEGEPDERLVRQVSSATRGYPRAIRDVLEWMLRHNWLEKGPTGWSLRAELPPDALAGLATAGEPPADNLPRPVFSLIGREDDVAHLKAALAAHHLVTLYGPDGVGKSMLSLQVARESRENFSDGVFWVSFTEGMHREAAALAVAAALGLKFSALEDALEQLAHYLAEHQALVCLDDIHLVQGATQFVSGLVSGGSAARLLLTSNHPLGLEGELVYPLSGIKFPSDDFKDPLSYPAVRLFLRHAQPVEIDLAADGEVVAEICRLLNGQPLSIEIAARWTAMMSCRQIAARLSSHLQPGAGHETAALMATFATTWQMFSPEEQRALRRLSVMQGEFSVSAALAVSGVSPFFLNALHTHALLWSGNLGTYRFHTAFHRFLITQQAGHESEIATTRRRHALYFLARIPEISDTSAYPEVLAQFDNLVVAWEWALAHGEFNLIYKALPGIADLLRHAAYFVQGIVLWERAWEGLQKEALGLDLPLEIRLRRFLGEFHYHIGQYTGALDWLTLTGENEIAKTALRNRLLYSDYLEMTGERAAVLSVLGRHQEAEEEYRRALSLASLTDDPEFRYRVQNGLGVSLYRQGDYPRAAAEMERSLTLARQLGKPERVAQALNNLSNAVLALGDFARARELAQECIALLRGDEHVTFRAAVLDTLGKVNTRLGDYQAAGQAFSEALRLLVRRSAKPLVTEILVSVAELHAARGEWEKAVSLARYCQHTGAAPQSALERARRLCRQADASVPPAADTPLLESVVAETLAGLQPLAQPSP